MNSILQTLKELPKKLYEIQLTDKNIGEFLEECQAVYNETILLYARQRIEELDQAILACREERGNFKVVKSGVSRGVETKAGFLEYERRYYRDTHTKEYAYLVDAALGLAPYQRIEDELQLSLVEAASQMSYRKASDVVCEGRVSASSVMNAIRKVEIPEETPKEIRKRVEELHVQADEDHVRLQQQGKKAGQIRFAALHEPKVRVGQGRYELPQRHILSSVKENPEAFGERLLDTLDARYDLDHVKRIYLHGDGASWIESLRRSLPRSIPILDHFHLEKALLGVCKGDRRLRNLLRSCLQPWDDVALEKELQMLVDSDVCTEDKARKLWVYLQNNREGIVNHFTLDHGGSCAEGLVSHVFSKRFSRDPLAWSIKSLRKLSEIRVHLENGEKLSRSMLRKEETQVEKRVPLLSAAKTRVAKKDKKEFGDWNVSIPGSGLSSGAIGAIIKRINRGGFIC